MVVLQQTGDVQYARDSLGDRMNDRLAVAAEPLQRFDVVLFAAHRHASPQLEGGGDRVGSRCLFAKSATFHGADFVKFGPQPFLSEAEVCQQRVPVRKDYGEARAIEFGGHLVKNGRCRNHEPAASVDLLDLRIVDRRRWTKAAHRYPPPGGRDERSRGSVDASRCHDVPQ